MWLRVLLMPSVVSCHRPIHIAVKATRTSITSCGSIQVYAFWMSTSIGITFLLSRGHGYWHLEFPLFPLPYMHWKVFVTLAKVGALDAILGYITYDKGKAIRSEASYSLTSKGQYIIESV